MAGLVLALALAGCSSTHTQTAPTPTAAAGLHSTVAMSAAQKAELSDGTVTYDEYLAAFRRYVACDAKAGYTITQSGETNEVLNFAVPSAAVDSGVDDRCLQREFSQVDTRWQLSRADTSPQAQAYAVCLQKAGITPGKTEGEKFHQLEKAKIDPTKCYEDQSSAGPTG